MPDAVQVALFGVEPQAPPAPMRPKCTAGVPDSAVGESGGIPLDAAPRVSHGAGTDVRAWWPGCRDHEPDVSNDQFRCRPSDDPRPLP